MHISPLSCYFLHFRSNCSPVHRVLKHPNLHLSLYMTQTKRDKIYTLIKQWWVFGFKLSSGGKTEDSELKSTIPRNESSLLSFLNVIHVCYCSSWIFKPHHLFEEFISRLWDQVCNGPKSFENIEKFKYFGATLTNQYCNHEETMNRFN
jgi:hypothetical protein